MRILSALTYFVLVMMPGFAWAQMSDLCSGPLKYQASPIELKDFRQQCTIQKLITERGDEAMQRTGAEVQQAVAEAHAKAVSEELTKANDKATALEKYWKDYSTSINVLTDAINATCAWRGTFNEPTAKMCKLWNQK